MARVTQRINNIMAINVRRLLQKYNTLGASGRILILVGILAATLMLWDATYQAYIDNETARIEKEKENLNGRIADLEQQIRNIAGKKQPDPNAQRRITLFNLTKEVTSLDEQLKRMTVSLIDPKQMTDLVENLFTNTSGLRLISLKSLGAKPLTLNPDSGDQSDEGGVYMHGMVIEFEGGFFDTLDYIRALESLPWQLYWGGIDYQVVQYPIAHVSLLVYTLSLSEGWIGT
jgi:MSHA biogenesis protein MshJ